MSVCCITGQVNFTWLGGCAPGFSTVKSPFSLCNDQVIDWEIL